MKKIWIITCMLFFCQITANSQPCLPDGITFSTQEQIDNFQTNYPNCTGIEGDVTINGDDITNLNGLNVLTSIGGDLMFGYSYYGNYNPNLTSLTGLEDLTSIGGGLSFRYNNALTSLTGLDNVTSISVDLRIQGNNALTSLTGLNNVISIGGDIVISSNNVLASLADLGGLTAIGGDFYFYNNDALTSLTGLDQVTSIGGDLSIIGNNALSSLTGMDNVATIRGNLVLVLNNALTSLTGLDNVTSIEGDLKISDNNALTSLIGLGNVTFIGGDLHIHRNDSLVTCEVQSICDYLASPNGEIEIHDNAPGCNNHNEVEEACSITIVEEITEGENYTIYPNPVTDIATFSSDEITSFELYDLMGTMVLNRNGNKVDMTNMNAGIYFVIGFDKNLHPLYKGKTVKK